MLARRQLTNETARSKGPTIADNVGFTRSFGGALCQFLITVKAYSAAKICPKRLASPAKHTSRCAGRSDLRRVGPSTRGATAPQGAQLVNLVLCRRGAG